MTFQFIYLIYKILPNHSGQLTTRNLYIHMHIKDIEEQIFKTRLKQSKQNKTDKKIKGRIHNLQALGEQPYFQ